MISNKEKQKKEIKRIVEEDKKFLIARIKIILLDSENGRKFKELKSRKECKKRLAIVGLVEDKIEDFVSFNETQINYICDELKRFLLQ